MRRIKLMTDYYCFPIWEAGPGVGNVDPETLPITDELRQRLRAWSETYDNILNREDPASSAWPSTESRKAFDTEGRRIWRCLKLELGSDYDVVYYSESEGRLLTEMEQGT